MTNLTPRLRAVSILEDSSANPAIAWLAGLLAALMIVASTVERYSIAIGPANIYLAQIVAIALLPTFFSRERTVERTRKLFLLAVAASTIAALPSLSMSDPGMRIFIPLQYAANTLTLVVALSLFRSVSPQALKAVVRWTTFLFTLAIVAQISLAPEWNTRGTSTLGIPRPVLLFMEEGWLGTFAAMLMAAAIGLSLPLTSFVLAVIVLLNDNRGSLLIALAGFATAFRFGRGRLGRILIVTTVATIATSLVIAAATGTPWLLGNDDTVGTRMQDIQAILAVNNGDLLPWGGETLTFVDTTRSRELAGSSNSWLMELVWKLGFGGIAIFLIFTALMAKIAPGRIATPHDSPGYWAPRLVLMILPAVFQFNNAMGRSWFWVSTALLFAVMALPDRADPSA